MARRKLTVAEQLKGIEKAIQSPRTPPQLKAGLRVRAKKLRKQLNRQVGPGRNLLKRLGLERAFDE